MTMSPLRTLDSRIRPRHNGPAAGRSVIVWLAPQYRQTGSRPAAFCYVIPPAIRRTEIPLDKGLNPCYSDIQPFSLSAALFIIQERFGALHKALGPLFTTGGGPGFLDVDLMSPAMSLWQITAAGAGQYCGAVWADRRRSGPPCCSRHGPVNVPAGRSQPPQLFVLVPGRCVCLVLG